MTNSINREYGVPKNKKTESNLFFTPIENVVRVVVATLSTHKLDRGAMQRYTCELVGGHTVLPLPHAGREAPPPPLRANEAWGRRCEKPRA